jgi:hypothetical protein
VPVTSSIGLGRRLSLRLVCEPPWALDAVPDAVVDRGGDFPLGHAVDSDVPGRRVEQGAAGVVGVEFTAGDEAPEGAGGAEQGGVPGSRLCARDGVAFAVEDGLQIPAAGPRPERPLLPLLEVW